jgi:hypothetical protein
MDVKSYPPFRFSGAITARKSIVRLKLVSQPTVSKWWGHLRFVGGRFLWPFGSSVTRDSFT